MSNESKKVEFEHADEQVGLEAADKLHEGVRERAQILLPKSTKKDAVQGEIVEERSITTKQILSELDKLGFRPVDLEELDSGVLMKDVSEIKKR